jgi:hypothetical protein
LGHIFVLKSQKPISGCPRFKRLAIRLGTFFISPLKVSSKEMRFSFHLLYVLGRRFSKKFPIFKQSSIAQSYWEILVDRFHIMELLLYIKAKDNKYISFEKGNFYYSRGKIIIKDFYFFKENYPLYYQDFFYKNENNGFIFFFDFQSTIKFNKEEAVQLYLKAFELM